MKKSFLCIIVICCLALCYSATAKADTGVNTSSDLNDIVIKLLMPQIQSAVDGFYAPYLTVSPTVASYYGTRIIGIKDGELSIETTPYVGSHISVGKDRTTFNISSMGQVTLKDFKHIESHMLPPHLQSLIKKPLP